MTNRINRGLGDPNECAWQNVDTTLCHGTDPCARAVRSTTGAAPLARRRLPVETSIARLVSSFDAERERGRARREAATSAHSAAAA